MMTTFSIRGVNVVAACPEGKFRMPRLTARDEWFDMLMTGNRFGGHYH